MKNAHIWGYFRKVGTTLAHECGTAYLSNKDIKGRRSKTDEVGCFIWGAIAEVWIYPGLALRLPAMSQSTFFKWNREGVR
jgi:hypothetical protein